MNTCLMTGPSIPAKNQKILKTSPHASKLNKFLDGNMRYHHRRQKSQALESSIYSKSPDRQNDVISLHKAKKRGFASSSHRFDKKKDFQRFFDSTPGPGSYNLIQELQKIAWFVLVE